MTTFIGNEVQDCSGVLHPELRMTESAALTAAPVVTGIIGELEEFDPKSDSISAYVEWAQLFLEANNVPEGKYVSTADYM